MRFPGYETTSIADGVPEGWEKGRADHFFDITIGKTPPRAESQWFSDMKNGIPWLSISDMGNAGVYIFDTSEGLTREAIKRHNVKVVPTGTILLSFKLTVGRVSITTMDICTNEAIAHFRVKDACAREYTYSYLKIFHYDTLGSTSAISKAVNSKIIKAMPFLMPQKNILMQFSNQAKPIFELIKKRQAENVYLAQARDRLLPKLMSGELEV